MSNKAFGKIAEGLREALAIARGEKPPTGVSEGRRHSMLTEEQLAEVRRRRADPKRKLVSHEEARRRIRRLGK